MPVLVLDDHDEARELEFEIEYQLSLTFEERWSMMMAESERIARQLLDSGQREPHTVTKRA